MLIKNDYVTFRSFLEKSTQALPFQLLCFHFVRCSIKWLWFKLLKRKFYVWAKTFCVLFDGISKVRFLDLTYRNNSNVPHTDNLSSLTEIVNIGNLSGDSMNLKKCLRRSFYGN